MSIGTVAAEHHPGGADDDVDVHPDGPGIDIFSVEAGPLGKRGVIASGDLPQAGDPGYDANVMAEEVAVHLTLVQHDGARADNAHVAKEDVEELREFIEAEAAQESSDTGDARVVLELLVGGPLAGSLGVGVEIGTQHLIGVFAHSAKLEHVKHTAIFADAFLAVQHSPRRIEGDEQGNEGQEGGENDEAGYGDKEVEQALLELGGAVHEGVAHLEGEHVAVLTNAHAAQVHLEVFGGDNDDGLEEVAEGLADSGEAGHIAASHHYGADGSERAHAAEAFDQLPAGIGESKQVGAAAEEQHLGFEADFGIIGVVFGYALSVAAGANDSHWLAPAVQFDQEVADDGAAEGNDDEHEEPGHGHLQTGERTADAQEEGGDNDHRHEQAGDGGDLAELLDGTHTHGRVKVAQGGRQHKRSHKEGNPEQRLQIERTEQQGAHSRSQRGRKQDGGKVGEDHGERHKVALMDPGGGVLLADCFYFDV